MKHSDGVTFYLRLLMRAFLGKYGGVVTVNRDGRERKLFLFKKKAKRMER